MERFAEELTCHFGRNGAINPCCEWFSTLGERISLVASRWRRFPTYYQTVGDALNLRFRWFILPMLE